MKKAFVTGGSGFVGRNLIRRLRGQGLSVAALARSESAANTVASLGAVPVRGDLLDETTLAEGMVSCDVVFHAAAKVDEWGARADYRRINVEGTRVALAAARTAGVGCFVHVGTEAIYADGKQDMNGLHEDIPVPDRPLPRYPETKAEAERLVLAADGPGMRCVSLRPRLIWGNDDTSVLPAILEMVKQGRFAWISGGQARTSTTHVDNVCHGLLLAADKGRGGQAYFVSDGEPVSIRDFLGAQMRAQGVTPPDRSIPFGLVRVIAWISEGLWDVLPLPGQPPAVRFAIELIGRSVVIKDDKARQELGYAPVTRREDALPELLAHA